MILSIVCSATFPSPTTEASFHDRGRNVLREHIIGNNPYHPEQIPPVAIPAPNHSPWTTLRLPRTYNPLYGHKHKKIAALRKTMLVDIIALMTYLKDSLRVDQFFTLTLEPKSQKINDFLENYIKLCHDCPPDEWDKTTLQNLPPAADNDFSKIEAPFYHIFVRFERYEEMQPLLPGKCDRLTFTVYDSKLCINLGTPPPIPLPPPDPIDLDHALPLITAQERNSTPSPIHQSISQIKIDDLDMPEQEWPKTPTSGHSTESGAVFIGPHPKCDASIQTDPEKPPTPTIIQKPRQSPQTAAPIAAVATPPAPAVQDKEHPPQRPAPTQATTTYNSPLERINPPGQNTTTRPLNNMGYDFTRPAARPAQTFTFSTPPANGATSSSTAIPVKS